MARQVFARALPPPDLAGLLTAVVAIVGPAALTPEMDTSGVLTIAIDKPAAWVAGDIASVQTAVTAAVAASPALAQQAAIDALPVVPKALLLALIDQLNVIRAALPVPLGAITPAAAIAAVRTKAGTL